MFSRNTWARRWQSFWKFLHNLQLAWYLSFCAKNFTRKLETHLALCVTSQGLDLHSVRGRKCHSSYTRIAKPQQDTCCATEDNFTEIGIIRACRVHSGLLASYQMKIPNAEKRTSDCRQKRSRNPTAGLLSRPGDETPRNLANLPGKMVTACGAESLTLRKQLSGPYQLKYEDCKVIAGHKPSERKKPQMQTHGNVERNDKERGELDWHDKVKIGDAYVQFKDKIIEILSDFASIWNGHLGRVNIAKHRVKVFPAHVNRFNLRHAGRDQNDASLRKTDSTKCCQTKFLSRFRPTEQHQYYSRRRRMPTYDFELSTWH